MLEHLFEKNVEGTMGAKELKSEFGELKQIYDESVRNTNALEAEIAGMKGEHETEKVSGGYPYKQHILVGMPRMISHLLIHLSPVLYLLK